MQNMNDLMIDLENMPWWKTVWKNLSNQVDNNTLPHAILLAVNEGFGPQVLMTTLAKRLHCSQLKNDWRVPCGGCDSCNKINRRFN